MEKVNQKKMLEKNLSLLNCIKIIAQKAKFCKLNLNKLQKDKEYLEVIQKTLKVPALESILFSVLFTEGLKDSNITIKDMAQYLDCEPIDLLEQKAAFDNLLSKKLIQFSFDNNYFTNSKRHGDREYFIPTRIINAIIENPESIQTTPQKNNTLWEFWESIKNFFDDLEKNIIKHEDGLDAIHKISSEFSNLKIVKQIQKYNLDYPDVMLLLYVCYQTINGQEETELNEFTDIMDFPFRMKVSFKRNLLKGTSELMVKNLLTFTEDNFVTDRYIKLTPEAITNLLGDEYLPKKKNDFMLVIAPEDIKEKKLFFAQKETEHLKLLQHILEEDNFEKMSRAFDENAIAKGLSVMLYGAPGTGKTEMVMQMAHVTQRKILRINISSIKSMWFGKSEKNLQKLFDDYKQLLKTEKRTPILFFNEADAIFSKRGQIADNNVRQTENALQNILLQELEQLQGILIATTNLTENFDKAFERRFLYKIQFQIPNVEVRAKIIRDKLQWLNENDAMLISKQFSLSGAQIENLQKKYLFHCNFMQENITIEKLQEWCRMESLGNNRTEVGFIKR